MNTLDTLISQVLSGRVSDADFSAERVIAAYEGLLSYAQAHALQAFVGKGDTPETREAARAAISLADEKRVGAIFDLKAGTVLAVDGVLSTSMQQLSDGWWRCAVTYASGSGHETRSICARAAGGHRMLTLTSVAVAVRGDVQLRSHQIESSASPGVYYIGPT